MRKCFPTIKRVHLVQISLCLVSCVIVVAIIGRPKTASPAPAPRPVFTMPSAGALTDTSLRIGDSFPEIQTVDLDGNAVTFDKQLLGDRYTLIVFWSTWCGFCMQELPHEIELAKQYEKAGLRVIGVNADDTTTIAKAAAKDNGVPWLNVFEGPDKKISNELDISQWPALLLVGPNGKLIIATQQLRSIGVETLPDGSTRTVNGLDWALKELLDNK